MFKSRSKQLIKSRTTLRDKSCAQSATLLVLILQTIFQQTSGAPSDAPASVPFKTSFVSSSDYPIRRNGALMSMQLANAESAQQQPDIGLIMAGLSSINLEPLWNDQSYAIRSRELNYVNGDQSALIDGGGEQQQQSSGGNSQQDDLLVASSQLVGEANSSVARPNEPTAQGEQLSLAAPSAASSAETTTSTPPDRNQSSPLTTIAPQSSQPGAGATRQFSAPSHSVVTTLPPTTRASTKTTLASNQATETTTTGGGGTSRPLNQTLATTIAPQVGPAAPTTTTTVAPRHRAVATTKSPPTTTTSTLAPIEQTRRGAREYTSDSVSLLPNRQTGDLLQAQDGETFASNRSTTTKASSPPAPARQAQFVSRPTCTSLDDKLCGNFIVASVPVLDKRAHSNSTGANGTATSVVNEFVFMPEDSGPLNFDESAYSTTGRPRGLALDNDDQTTLLKAEHRSADGDSDSDSMEGDGDVELDYISADGGAERRDEQPRPTTHNQTAPPISVADGVGPTVRPADGSLLAGRQATSATSQAPATRGADSQNSTLRMVTMEPLFQSQTTKLSTPQPTTTTSKPASVRPNGHPRDRASPAGAHSVRAPDQNQNQNQNQKDVTPPPATTTSRPAGERASNGTAPIFGLTSAAPQAARKGARENQKLMREPLASELTTDPDVTTRRDATAAAKGAPTPTPTPTPTTRRPPELRQAHTAAAGDLVGPRRRPKSAHRKFFSEPAGDWRRRQSPAFSPTNNGADEEEANILTRYLVPSQLARLSSVSSTSGGAHQAAPASKGLEGGGVEGRDATSGAPRLGTRKLGLVQAPTSAKSAVSWRQTTTTTPSPGTTVRSSVFTVKFRHQYTGAQASAIRDESVARAGAQPDGGGEHMTLISSSIASVKPPDGSAKPAASGKPQARAAGPQPTTTFASFASSAPTQTPANANESLRSIAADANDFGSIEDQLARDALHNGPPAASPATSTRTDFGSAAGSRWSSASHEQQVRQVNSYGRARTSGQTTRSSPDSSTNNGMWKPDTNDRADYSMSGPSNGDNNGDSLSGSLLPGRPGIDYPVHWQVPKTSFDCRNYEQSGFYADVESDCQAYHSCHRGRGGRHTFLCPNGTLFSQELLTCDWWYNVECSASRLYMPNENGGSSMNMNVGTMNELGHLSAAAA